MDHAQHLSSGFPWRTAAVVTAAIAAAELLALIAVGTLHFARPLHHTAAKPKPAPHHAAVHVTPVAPPPPSHPVLARSRVAVLVLNGNGAPGAAHAEAVRLQGIGYRIGGAQNAVRHDYARSMVMYVPGYVLEARRLAHDVGVALVAPVDGLTPARLKASRLVLLLGN